MQTIVLKFSEFQMGINCPHHKNALFSMTIGSYREIAIAIESEAGDSLT